MPADPTLNSSAWLPMTVVGLMLGSAAVWGWIVRTSIVGLPLIPRRSREAIRWEPAVVLLAFGWLGFGILMKLASAFPVSGEAAAAPANAPTLPSVAMSLAISSGVFLVLLAALWGQSPSRSLREYGITLREIGEQLRVAVVGALASVIPVAGGLRLMAPFRSEKTQHSLFALLKSDPRWETLVLVFVAAAVVAPLFEELLFRVVLQGWLETRTSAPAAIGLTMAVFAAVHGWRDAVPLLPLAGILGYVYHRTQRYFAVVMIHALFNGTMLAAAVWGARLG